MQFSDIKSAIHKFIFSLFGAIVLFIVAGVIFFFGFSLLRPDGFTVLGGNFDTNYRKLPFDQKSIDFTLSSDIKEESVKSENFEVFPKIDGVWSLKDNHTLSFAFGEKINQGDEISFTLKSQIESQKGEKLGHDYNYDINIVSSPKVVKITPSGNLESLSQNIAVFFNIPVVALSSLEKKDTLPCPITIVPAIEGKCQWTTSSVLEFIPTTGFQGATKYTISFQNQAGLLYTINEGAKVELITPSLQAFHQSRFVVGEGIPLDFNFPVDQKDIEKNVELYSFTGGKIDSDTYLSQEMQDMITLTHSGSTATEKTLGAAQKLDFDVVPSKDSQSGFSLMLKNKKFEHLTFYKIVLKKGLLPKLGNIPLEETGVFYSLSYSFLQNLEVYRNIFSSTGSIIDTKSFGPTPAILPVKDIFLQLNFEQEISSLATTNFIFQDAVSGEKFDFDIKYIKEASTEKEEGKDTFKTVENKKRVQLTLKKNLKPSSQYTFTIKKEIHSDLQEDVGTHFSTPATLALADFKFVGYEKTCLYFNNPVDNIWDKKDDIFSTSPVSRISNITDYEWIPDDILKYNDEEIVKRGYCPNAKNGNILYIANTRLNPKTEYTMSIKNTFSDIYGTSLSLAQEKKVKTGEIEEKDKYLYISLSKEINVIPSQIPITLNLQTVNLDSATIDVCELDTQGYMQYTINKYTQNYQAPCTIETKVPVKVQNKFWTLSNNKFDLEDDVLKKKLTQKIVLVRGYKNDQEKSFENVFIRSNLSLVFEKGGNKSLLFATDFLGAFPNEPITLNFYNYDYNTTKFREVFPKYTFNKDTKVYEFQNSEFTYVTAQSKNYFSFLNLNDDAFSNYDFKYVGGVSASEKNYLYLYTDRPIYKPGDTVNFKGLLRQFEITGYKKSDIKSGKLQVLDENYKNILTLDITLDKNSNFNGKFDIPKDISVGKMSFLFQSGENFVKNDAYFHVEEYIKPPFKTDISEAKADYMLGESMSVDVTPSYYFGGKLTNAQGQYSILTQNYYFDAKDYSNFQFGEDTRYFDCVYWGYCQYDDSLGNVESFKIDENGKYTLKYEYPKSQENGEKIYSFNVDVTDPDTGNVVSKTISKVLHNTDAYVGLDVPYWNVKGKEIKANVVTLDYNATPLASKSVQVELYSREWKSVKKQGVDGVFYDDYTLDEKKESTTSISTHQDGAGEVSLNPKGEGEYRVNVIYTGANGKTFHSSSIIYISSDQYINWYSGNNDVTDLVALKTLVKLGDTASYILKSPVDHGKVLLVVEKDDGILDYFVHDLTSYGDKIDIPVKDTYYPNYYVRAFLVGFDPKNPLPVYKRALSVTKVATDYKNLKVDIKTDKTSYLPGEKINLEVSVTNSKGKPVALNGSISIVDESVLALKGNPKKNPYAFFYDMKRYLGTFTAATLKNLIEKLEVKDVGNGEKGGAGDQAKGGDSIKKRGNFKDTAFWQADFTTDAQGSAKIKTTNLPDNLTTWVIETLVDSPEDNKIGINYTSVTTSQKLLIQDNLPSFFIAGDTLTLAPQVFNKSGKDVEVEVSIQAEKLGLGGTLKKKVTVKNADSMVVPFDVTVPSGNTGFATALSKITFTAQATDVSLKLADAIEKTLPIYPASTSEAVATTGKTKDASFDEHIDLGDTPTNTQLSLHYSPTLMSYITDGVDYLNNYPYGCSEQKTSSVMPNIYIKKLYSSVHKEFDLKTKMIDYYSYEKNAMVKKSVEQTIQDYLVDIRKFQNSDGGFVYFYDMDTTYRPNYSDFGLTAYILSSGAYIKDIGYAGEPKVYADAIAYLKNRFYKNKIEGCTVTQYYDCKYSDFERLSAIDSILNYNANDYEAYKMWKLLTKSSKDVTYNLKNAGVIGKLTKLKDVSESEKITLQTQAKKLLDTVVGEELVFTPRGSYIGKSLSYSRLQNTALFLEAISSLGLDGFKDIDTIIDNVNRWLLSQKKDGGFGSTQDTIQVIRALTTYIGVSKELDKVSFLAKFHLNGNEVESKKFDDTNSLEVYSKEFTGAILKSSNVFNITKDGNGTLYYDFSLRYDVPVEKVEARDEGFAITQDYFDYNEYKKIDALKKEEWKKYIDNEISYNNLKYPKSIYEYLTQVSSGTVGQLLVVRNKLITSEARDKVAFESFIPSGSQLINPNLDTSTKSAMGFTNDMFEKSEYRLDRYFGFTTALQPGIYDVAYLIRLSNKGSFVVKPTKAYEFYHTEVFGRDAGKRFEVK